MLEHFVFAYREEIIRRCRQKVARRSTPPPTASELHHGVGLCLDDVIDALRLRLLAIPPSFSQQTVAHRRHRLRHEFTASQVAHDYGDVCQAITEVATEKRVPISAEDFHILSRCRDEALAAAFAEERHELDRTVKSASHSSHGSGSTETG